MGRITAFLSTGTRVEISNERHRWFADEPAEAGGTDEGPTPYDMLLGALAACTTLTLKYYTAHKGIDIAWVRAEYDFDRVHSQDCAQCEEADEGMIERVTAHVTIGGSFSEAQQHRLRQIVSRCPVHKSLAHGIRIFDNVSFASGSATGTGDRAVVA